jgi:hypothetical protein
MEHSIAPVYKFNLSRGEQEAAQPDNSDPVSQEIGASGGGLLGGRGFGIGRELFGRGEKSLQLGGQCGEGNELCEILVRQFANFAFVIRQWF